jgi:pyruvate,orthophosphate dikinase
MFKLLIDKELNEDQNLKIKNIYSNILNADYEFVNLNTGNTQNDLEHIVNSFGANVITYGLYISTEELSINKDDIVLGIGLNKIICEKAEKDKEKIYRNYLLLLRQAIQLHEQTSGKKEKRLYFISSIEELSTQEIKEEIISAKKIFVELLGYDFPEKASEQLSFFLDHLSKKWNKEANLQYRKSTKTDPWKYFAFFPVNDAVYDSSFIFVLSRNIDDDISGHLCSNGDNEKVSEITKKLEKKYQAVISFYYLEINKFSVICDLRIIKADTINYLHAISELQKDGIITESRLIELLNIGLIDRITNCYFDDEASALSDGKLLCKGIAASNFVATGKIITDQTLLYDDDCILFKDELLPSDISLIKNIAGIITKQNSITSHPAVIMRQMGKAFICGCSDLQITGNSIVFDNKTLDVGSYVSINGINGNIYEGKLKVIKNDNSPFKSEVIKILKKVSKVNVLCNTESPSLLKEAIDNGADGIGLFRTEYMLDDYSKKLLGNYLTCNDLDEQIKIMEEMASISTEKFKNIFVEAGDRTCHIRSFDFPLHELFDRKGEDSNSGEHTNLFEFNPMLGNRGCRLSIIYPEIFVMQVKTIFEAYLQTGKKAKLGILLPMISDVNEILFLKNIIQDITTSLEIGAMLETPRALFTINEIAKHVDFLSIGTNDLTQMSWAISRDDSHRYLPDYLSKKIIRSSPFIRFDKEGMYDILFNTIEQAKKINPKIMIGFCGEQANDGESLEMFLNMNIDFVSISPKKTLQTLYYCARKFNGKRNE